MPDTRAPSDMEALKVEIGRLRQELEESRETLRAIRSGEIDAFVVEGEDQTTILTLGAAEQTYQLIVDQVGHPTALLTVDGRILQSNAQFAELLQRSDSALSGQQIMDMVAPASLHAIERLLEDGQAREVERDVIIRTGAGRNVPASFAVRPLKDNPTGLCLMLTDRTAERERDRMVSEEILAQSILEQVGDAVVVCDRDGRVARFSRAAARLAGDDLTNRPFDDALPLRTPVDGELKPLTFGMIAAAPETKGWEAVHTGLDGRDNHLILSAGFLFSKAGAMRGVVLTFTDITARKKAERALEVADRRKTEFLAILAHELRNPLAPISNGIRLLASNGVNAQVQDKALALMDRQVRNMVRLVDDLMDVSRITRGTIELKRERLRLSDVLRVAAETSEPLVTQFGHTLQRGPVDEDIWLEGDFTRLTQIFSNLINNACKYSENDRTIDISVMRADEAVSVRVRDQGIGIRPEMLERIFDMFTQVDGSLERSHGGLGVGLTLVRNLVEMHGGDVSAISAGPGKGASFIVTLPIASEPSGESVDEAVEEGDAGALRVLIVEDNPALAQTAGWLVETMGHDYRLAHNGNDALAVAGEYRPDVVLMDIGLPGMNGYDICRLMRQKPELKDTLFVAQTGWGQQEHRQMASDAGFHHHMVKPVDYDKLQTALEAFAAGRSE